MAEYNGDLAALAQMFGQWIGVAEDRIKNYTCKSFLLEEQDRVINQLKRNDAEQGNYYKTNYILQHESGLKKPLQVDLLSSNRVNISELTKSIDQCVKGKFLLCRIISPPVKMTGVVLIVDDPEGNLAVRFALYNFSAKKKKGKVKHPLSIGTIMAVKNPFFKTSGDGGYGLRSDNPGDVTFLSEAQCQQLFPYITWKSKIPKKYRAVVEKGNTKTAESWKILGNKHFAEKNFSDALNAYTSGLKIDAQNVNILSNRAAAYLQMSAFSLALGDANKVLKIQPSHVKAIYRKGKALCGLKRYKEAWEFLSHINAVDLQEDDRDEMIKLKKTIKLFLLQQETGNYDIALMLKKTKDNPRYRFNYADYTGPVEIHEAHGKGRGMFVTEDVHPGQLLIGCKAFATCLSDSTANDVKNVDISDGNKESMESYIARMLATNPDRGKDFYKLYAGPDLRYLDHNLGDDTSFVDKKRINKICLLNTFEPYHYLNREDAAPGIWLLPSFINHSCFDCNCTFNVFGDFMLIRSFKVIPKGEEVLISYIPIDQTYPQRMELFEKHRFLCECKLCLLDQKESKEVHQKREQLLHDFFDLVRGELLCDSSIYSYYVNRIGALRLANPELNVYVIRPLFKLAGVLQIEKQSIKLAETLEKVYNLTKGTSLCNVTLHVAISIIGFNLIGSKFQKEKAMKWVDVLKESAVLTYGTTSAIDVIGPTNFMQSLKMHGWQL